RPGGHDDFAFRCSGVLRVKRDRAGDVAGAAVDGFERRIEFEPGVVNALGVLEVERLWRGESSARQGDGCQEGEFRFHYLVSIYGCFDFAGTKKETPARNPAPNKAAPRKSTPGTNLSCH